MDLEAKVVAWVEREIGPVRTVSRQGRWRPAWYIDAEVNGKPAPLYVRGDRGGRWPPMPLAYEARVHQILADSGVKAPRLYGYIDEIPALVMERVRGRPNMATAASDADRRRLREQLADQMRLIHEIDPKRLEAAGSPNPVDPREITLSHYRQAEGLYLSGARLPSPEVEFIRGWLNRNVPPCDEGPVVIAMDAGQFIFEGDELTAMLDFEFVVVGDRHVDFAALRTRDRFEAIGDLDSFFDLYEARGGRPVDRDRVHFQHIPFAMYAVLEVAAELASPRSAADYFEYLRWHVDGTQTALGDIADLTGVELQPYVLPAPAQTRFGVALEAIDASLSTLAAADKFAAYQKFRLGMALEFLGLWESHRPAFEREYLADVARVTGIAATDEWDCEVKLEAFVQAADPQWDARLVRLLHRRGQRVRALIDRVKGPRAGVSLD